MCRRLRWAPQTRTLPILIVSAKGEESDIVAGIELGADDYVTKPFSPRVLMARVRSLLRRSGNGNDSGGASRRLSRADGMIVIDLDRHSTEIGGVDVDLTPTEFGILHCLATRPGFVRTRDRIVSAVHGQTTVLSRRAVDVHMTALRRKLGDAGSLIETVRGSAIDSETPLSLRKGAYAVGALKNTSPADSAEEFKMPVELSRDLTGLRRSILNMGSMVQQRVQRSVQALLEGRPDVARSVREGDGEIDEMDVDIEAECLRVLALTQPVAADLRLVMVVLRINNELERIDDLQKAVFE